ncbi:hypothetical protein EDB19DRAFT_564502 [Suillus lakei]|nr:hypothetical protein EDB19DRAFT_564502 [Suillus lakei]
MQPRLILPCTAPSTATTGNYPTFCVKRIRTDSDELSMRYATSRCGSLPSYNADITSGPTRTSPWSGYSSAHRRSAEELQLWAEEGRRSTCQKLKIRCSRPHRLSAPDDNCTRVCARKPTRWSSSESPRDSDDLQINPDRTGRNVVEETAAYCITIDFLRHKLSLIAQVCPTYLGSLVALGRSGIQNVLGDTVATCRTSKSVGLAKR